MDFARPPTDGRHRHGKPQRRTMWSIASSTMSPGRSGAWRPSTIGTPVSMSARGRSTPGAAMSKDWCGRVRATQYSFQQQPHEKRSEEGLKIFFWRNLGFISYMKYSLELRHIVAFSLSAKRIIKDVMIRYFNLYILYEVQNIAHLGHAFVFPCYSPLAGRHPQGQVTPRSRIPDSAQGDQ